MRRQTRLVDSRSGSSVGSTYIFQNTCESQYETGSLADQRDRGEIKREGEASTMPNR